MQRKNLERSNRFVGDSIVVLKNTSLARERELLTLVLLFELINLLAKVGLLEIQKTNRLFGQL